MVVGISTDASRPDGAGAVVASVDSQHVQWSSQIFRGSYQQHIGILVLQVTRLVASNKDICPQDIIIKRDGISVTDYQRQAMKEVGLLKCALQHACPSTSVPPGVNLFLVDTKPCMCFLSTCDTDPPDRKGPLSGTVVDRSVADPPRWDLYLQVGPLREERSPPVCYLVV